MIAYSSVEHKGEHVAPNNTTQNWSMTNWLVGSVGLVAGMLSLCLPNRINCVDGSVIELNRGH